MSTNVDETWRARPRFDPPLQHITGCYCTACIGVRASPSLAHSALRMGDRVRCNYGLEPCGLCLRINASEPGKDETAP